MCNYIITKKCVFQEFKSISKEQRDELLAQMTFIEVFLRKFDRDGQNNKIFDKFAELRTKVSNLEENGPGVYATTVEKWLSNLQLLELSITIPVSCSPKSTFHTKSLLDPNFSIMQTF